MDRRREMLPILRVHCDVRHEDGLGAQAMEQELRAAIDRIPERGGVRVETEPYATFGPVSSEGKLGALVRHKAPRQWRGEIIAAGASLRADCPALSRRDAVRSERWWDYTECERVFDAGAERAVHKCCSRR